jgi:hypothetical protein
MLKVQAFRSVRVKVAAAVVASVVSFGTAGAAPVFSLDGGAALVGGLPASFDVNTAQLGANGIAPGLAVTNFGGALNDGGLDASPQNVFISFEFLGKEAGFVNLFFAGAPIFANTVAPGTTTAFLPFNVGSDPGKVPFVFTAGDGGATTATNGGAINGNLNFAVALAAGGTIAYLFFDDGGGGVDGDYDDMSVKLTISCGPNGGECAPPVVTPLPAALPLFAGGLAVIGVLARRRKRKQSLVAA